MRLVGGDHLDSHFVLKIDTHRVREPAGVDQDGPLDLGRLVQELNQIDGILPEIPFPRGLSLMFRTEGHSDTELVLGHFHSVPPMTWRMRSVKILTFSG